MLDQSFSAENFRQILDYENRKGVYLEGKYFDEIATLTEQIKKCNSDIKEKKRSLDHEEFEAFRTATNTKKEELKERKETLLGEELQKISDLIVDSTFRITLTKNDDIADKPVYTSADNAENYFALKQIQYNFRKLYKVKQANRYAILSQLKGLLDDNFPKYVIRTDIKDFYESIPHDRLMQKLNEENLLTFYSKKLLFQILKEYKTLSGNDKGLPRGIGISAYLVELYMREIDSSIKSLPHVTYYARYVDDIVIIFTPPTTKTPRDYLDKIDDIIETAFLLQRNHAKTVEFDLIDTPANCYMDYLGYSIQFGNGPIKFGLTTKKVNRYKKRIDLVLDSYLNLAKVNEKKARKLLVKRIRFLTGNTRLLNNKKNILVGIYYSNSLITDSSNFAGIDQYLTHKIDTSISLIGVKNRMGRYSFRDGFVTKRFSPFSTHDLSKILEVWQNE